MTKRYRAIRVCHDCLRVMPVYVHTRVSVNACTYACVHPRAFVYVNVYAYAHAHVYLYSHVRVGTRVVTICA